MADWPYNTAAWQRLRKAKLSAHPMCEHHARQARVVPATNVDHVVPVKQGGEPFPPLEGLQSLCHSCHSIKTNTQDHGLPLKGCDANGEPLDPDDPWHRGGIHHGKGSPTDRRHPRKQTYFMRTARKWD